MANQGCINEGSDDRKFGWLICPLQKLFSKKSEISPKWLYKSGTDYVEFGIAWPPYIVIQNKVEEGYSLFRLGIRYDNNWKGYIFPTAAWKTIKEPMEKGY